MLELSKKYWSDDVKVKHNVFPPDFFKGSADSIAHGLKAKSDSYSQASKRLNFYKNRAGKNLSETDKQRLSAAADKLKQLYGKSEENAFYAIENYFNSK